MTETNVQENKMGVVPVPKLLFQMSLPMILSMLVQALYNVVDSVFVAQINENALTAVSLVFPVQSLMMLSQWVPVWVSMPCYPEVWEKKISEQRMNRRKTVSFWHS